ncbi:MAG TPA: 30S ribosomal protein S1 [Ktedonobacterales bacterium]|nr:30S ribosomal protein S1 [Ktedonobacterales bacterium]
MSSVDEEFTGQSSQGHDGQESAVDLNDVNDMPDMSEMQRLLEEQEAQFKSIKRGDVVEGQIVRMDQDEILVDIGLKSEGVLSTKELPNQGYGSLAELKMGDNVLVYVMQPETPEGHAIVSIKRARLERQWRVAQEQYERGDLLEAEVIDHNKGGLIVNLEGIRGFVPISQILNLKREDTADNQETQNKLQSMVGRKLQLKIIEINRNRNRLILSERLAVQEWRAKRREELLNELQVGEVRKGIVSNLSNFGAFVDLGGADGLVHISQLAWSRVNHPSEVLKVGQEVEVQVLSVDKEKKKIALSIKRAEVDPWTTVEARYQVGQLVHGTITKIAPFGAFARIEDGVEGLIHLSELPAGQQDPKAVLKEGQDVTVRILRIDAERRRLGLSIRQVDEIAPAAEEAPQATEHEATASHPSAEAPAEGAADVSAPSQPEQPAGRPEQPSRGRPRPQPEEAPMTAMAAAFQAAHAANQDRPQPEATASTPTATAPVEAPAETPPAPAPAEAAPAPVEAPAQDTAEAVSAPVEAPAAATPAEAAPAEAAPTPPEAAATPPAEAAEAAEAPVEAAPTPAPDVPEAEQTAAANGAADATTAAQAVEAPVTGPAAKTKRSAPAETPAAEGETSAPTEA